MVEGFNPVRYSIIKGKCPREIVMLVCMISFAVIGRVIFYMTPQVKPCAAIIIITGIALGKKAGFLTGAMTAFVSNFFIDLTNPIAPI